MIFYSKKKKIIRLIIGIAKIALMKSEDKYIVPDIGQQLLRSSW
jgi:hypothetical protein